MILKITDIPFRQKPGQPTLEVQLERIVAVVEASAYTQGSLLRYDIKTVEVEQYGNGAALIDILRDRLYRYPIQVVGVRPSPRSIHRSDREGENPLWE